MNDQLVLLGRRVHELRAAKKWSQEEFAHISGLHRTYIGQIERGEKNISFANLSKVATVLGVTLSGLLSDLEGGPTQGRESAARSKTPARSISDSPDYGAFEIKKLAERLELQQAALSKTIQELTKISHGGSTERQPGRPRRHPANKQQK